MTTRTSNGRFAVVILLAALGVLSGCGGKAPDAAASKFDGVPTIPKSRTYGPATNEHDTTSRSYFVDDMSPADVMAYHADHLPGAKQTTPPDTASNDDLRAVWRLSDGRVLTVSATRQPDPDRTSPAVGEGFGVQYDLQVT